MHAFNKVQSVKTKQSKKYFAKHNENIIEKKLLFFFVWLKKKSDVNEISCVFFFFLDFYYYPRSIMISIQLNQPRPTIPQLTLQPIENLVDPRCVIPKETVRSVTFIQCFIGNFVPLCNSFVQKNKQLFSCPIYSSFWKNNLCVKIDFFKNKFDNEKIEQQIFNLNSFVAIFVLNFCC